MSKEYYVYGAYGIHGELLYIGYGKGDRYKHCNNGMSSNKGLNRYYLNKEIPDWTVEHHLKVTKKLIKDGDKIIVNPKFIQHE